MNLKLTVAIGGVLSTTLWGAAPAADGPSGRHGWLNNRIFVGDLHVLPPERKAVLIRVYEVV